MFQDQIPELSVSACKNLFHGSELLHTTWGKIESMQTLENPFIVPLLTDSTAQVLLDILESSGAEQHKKCRCHSDTCHCCDGRANSG